MNKRSFIIKVTSAIFAWLARPVKAPAALTYKHSGKPVQEGSFGWRIVGYKTGGPIFYTKVINGELVDIPYSESGMTKHWVEPYGRKCHEDEWRAYLNREDVNP